MSRPDSPRRAVEPTPAAGGEHIRPEWVEAAARAARHVLVHATAEGDLNEYLVPDASEAAMNTLALDVATKALAAAVPAIQADAVREIRAVFNLQCRTKPSPDQYIEGAYYAHLWWWRVLGSALDRLERGELP